jgi:hypothetical protein
MKSQSILKVSESFLKKVVPGFLFVAWFIVLQTGCSPGIIQVVNDETRMPPPQQAPVFRDNQRIDDTPHSREHYGSSIAAGKFTQPGFNMELAVGIPGANGISGARNVGQVIIYPRNDNGEELDERIVLSPGLMNVLEQTGMICGKALASGDFDGNHADDLAIGCPGAANRSGLVIVSYGPDHQGNVSILTNINQPGGSRYFGWSLAAGDFDDDEMDDLIVGEPGVSTVSDEPPTTWVFWGNTSADGRLNINDATEIPVPAFDEQGDNTNFGASIAVGNFVSRIDASQVSPGPDIAIGAPAFDVETGEGTKVNVGKVYVFQPTANHQFIHAVSLLPNNDWVSYAKSFGHSLAAGNFNGDMNNGGAKTDLAIGAPHSFIPANDGIDQTAQIPSGERHFKGAGLVFLAPHETNQLGTNLRVISQDRMGFSEKNDHFGWSLAAGDFNHAGPHDLAIGTPDERISNGFIREKKAGAIYFRFGQYGTWEEDGGIPAVPVACFDYIDRSRGGSSSPGDRFGEVLYSTRFDDDLSTDLIVGAPLTDSNVSGKDAGAIWIGFNQTTELGPFEGIFQGHVNDDNGEVPIKLNIHDREQAMCGTISSNGAMLHFDEFNVDPMCLTISTLHDNSGHVDASRYDVVDEDGKVGELGISMDADDTDLDGTTDAALLDIHFISTDRDLIIDRLVTATRTGDPEVDPHCLE